MILSIVTIYIEFLFSFQVTTIRIEPLRMLAFRVFAVTVAVLPFGLTLEEEKQTNRLRISFPAVVFFRGVTNEFEIYIEGLNRRAGYATGLLYGRPQEHGKFPRYMAQPC